MQESSWHGVEIGDKLLIKIDRRRVRHYVVLVSATCWVTVWALWFMLGFMGSHSSPDGITSADVVRSTLYSLPVAIVLSAVFPMIVWGERNRWWLADETGIEVYVKDRQLVSVRWDELADIVFREFSVGIFLKDQTPDEYTIFLPSSKQCDRLSMLYNKAKGIHCEMDEETP